MALKLILNNCNLVFRTLNPSHVIVTDTFADYLQEGKALKDDNTVASISGYKTYYKIPVTKGMVVTYKSSATGLNSPYARFVFSDSENTVVKIQRGSSYIIYTFQTDGYLSISDERDAFVLYTANDNYTSINSDDYLVPGTALKTDGTTAVVGGYNAIKDVPVSAGDRIVFTTKVYNLASGYAAWFLKDSGGNVLSYGTTSVTEQSLTVAENGTFSLCYTYNQYGTFAGEVDVIPAD